MQTNKQTDFHFPQPQVLLISGFIFMTHFQNYTDEVALNTFNDSAVWKKKKFGDLGTDEQSGTYTIITDPVSTPPIFPQHLLF